MPMNRPILTPARLDAMLDGRNQSGGTAPLISRPSLATESLWGPKQIGAFMGLSPDTVRRMAKTDSSFPARIRFGRLYVTRTEIVVWLQPRHGDVRPSA